MSMNSRRRLAHIFVLMGGLQFISLGYIIWASKPSSADGIAPPLVIQIELVLGFFAASALPLWVAFRLQRGYGRNAARAVLLCLMPFIAGEISVPVLFVIRRFVPPTYLMPMLAAFALH